VNRSLAVPQRAFILAPEAAAERIRAPQPEPLMNAQRPNNTTLEELAAVLRAHDSFVLLSHVRPDGDAIGSQLALGSSLMAAGKRVRFFNDDGLPENLAFLRGSRLIETPPAEPLDVEVAIALDTGSQPRLGERSLHAASKAKIWLNIDHHISNPGYGDLNHIDPLSPATGQILYELIVAAGLPFPEIARDALYVAISTDTGSFQYSSASARTYEIGADLIRRGLDLGAINSATYDSHPFRRIELLRALLGTLERDDDGQLAHWELRQQTCRDLDLMPEDSEGLLDMIRGIRGVQVAVFFEELTDGKIRVSMRSKDRRYNVCDVATAFGGGGHPLAAGIRMAGPMERVKPLVLDALRQSLASGNA
jgi:phosphoesterase RecJ-like protein